MKRLTNKERTRAELYINSLPEGKKVGYACADKLNKEDEKWLESIGYIVITNQKGRGMEFTSVVINEVTPMPKHWLYKKFKETPNER